MASLERLTSNPIEPLYSQISPNEAIDFGNVKVQFTHDGSTHDAVADAKLSFAPKDRLHIVIPNDGPLTRIGATLFGDQSWNQKLTLPDRGVTIDVICTAAGGERGTVFTTKTSGITVTPISPEVSSAVFHLFNLPDFHGTDSYVLVTGDAPLQGFRSCGRIMLRSDGWKIAIAASERTKDCVKMLKEQGGYLLTHVGKIEREDGECFSSTDLEEQLHILTFFLSFAFGCWTAPALAVGMNPGGERVFEEWGIRRISEGPWNGDSSWFDEHHGELLTQVYPGFVRLWQSELWKKSLRNAIYFYVGANDPGNGVNVDTALMLTQAALELLAWNYCVRDRRMISASSFGRRGLGAHDKLRLLASSLNVPIDVPTSLTALQSLLKPEEDAMDVLTDLRNLVVHPSDDERPSGAYFEAWKLSMWFIEVVLLRLCGHTGRYANRLNSRWVGQIEPVPWAQAPNDVNGATA